MNTMTPERTIKEASLYIDWKSMIIDSAPAMTPPKAAPALNNVDR